MSNKRPLIQLGLLIERILPVVTILGLICFCAGFLLHVNGRISNNLTIARMGACMLVVGMVLLAARLLYWIVEKMVKKGLESMTDDAIIQTTSILLTQN